MLAQRDCGWKRGTRIEYEMPVTVRNTAGCVRSGVSAMPMPGASYQRVRPQKPGRYDCCSTNSCSAATPPSTRLRKACVPGSSRHASTSSGPASSSPTEK